MLLRTLQISSATPGKMPRIARIRRIHRLRMDLRRRRLIYLLLVLLEVLGVRRQIWVHPFNNLRFEKGEFYVLYADLRKWPPLFYKYYRMSINKFDALLDLVRPQLTRHGCNCREPIDAEQCLVLTIT